MPAQAGERIGRRRVLGAAVGGVTAAVAAVVAAPASALAADHDPVRLGEGNTATALTIVTNDHGHAFQAASPVGDGLRGFSDAGNCSGVFGYAADAGGFGVYGKNGGRGVAALGTYGAALWASTNGYAAPLALQVDGRAQFSRSGVITIPKGAKKAPLPLLPVTVTSRTFGLAIAQQVRVGVYVQAVVRSGATMWVYLNKAATASLRVAWMVFEKP